MILIVRSLDGSNFEIDVDLEDSIREVKGKIFIRLGLYPKNLRLIFISNELDDDRKIRYYPLQKESTIFLVYRFPSG